MSATGDAISSLIVKAEEPLIGERMIEPVRLLTRRVVVIVAIEEWIAVGSHIAY